MSALAVGELAIGDLSGDSARLPRLLYIGDVPVQSTVAGSTLLYRLLQTYPKERLRIAEGNLWQSRIDKRLEGVEYCSFEVGTERLLRTRLHPYYSSFIQLTEKFRGCSLKRVFNEFQPEAILTVAHGYSWLTAARLAEEFELPLHLILHDDWVSVQRAALPSAIHKALDRKFSEVYKQASSRLCASPYMMEDFAKKYGQQGEVLYPSRAANVQPYNHVPTDTAARAKVTFAFAGTVNTPGYAHSLGVLASVLASLRAALVVYSNLPAEEIESCGLIGTHVTVRPILPVKELIESLRETVDVLFVPMSFADEDAENMRVAFPSKLADYTSAGLPLLIWGPSYCSAIRWATENNGVAECVNDPATGALSAAVSKLMGDPPYRRALGEAALAKGREFFSHSSAVNQFYQMLNRTV